MSSIHPIPKNMKNNKTPQKPEGMNAKWFILGAIGLILIALALLLMSHKQAPAPAPISPQEQGLHLYEFRLKTGEQLSEKELEHYCQLLCQARGLCGMANCQDAVLLYRASALAHLKETLQGQQVIMTDGRSVKITGEGLRHTLKGKNLKNPREYAKNIKFIDTTFNLKNLLKGLKYKGTEQAKNCNCKAIHIYKGKLSGGYRIRVVVKESHAGDFTFYDYRLETVEI